MDCLADVLEGKRVLVFEPMNCNDQLFGMGFKQFQVKIMSD
jgi:hypothetical protein